MKCGLVILNYKDYMMTQKLLETIKYFPEINHIAVVDNNSPNESYEVLKHYAGDKISVIKSDRNGGYSYGNNIGIRHLIKNFSPDIIGIANPDVIFSNELVKRIKETFKANPDYAVLTGFQLNENNEAGCHPFWEDNHTTASSILKPMFCEEEVLAKKIKALGKKAGVVNNVTFIHAHREHKNNNPFTFSPLERGQIFYFCNYITKSKSLHALYITLMYLLRLKRLLKESIKKIISPFRK